MERTDTALFPGITLSRIQAQGEETLAPDKNQEGILLHYCQSGQIGWRLPTAIHLAPGDFLLTSRNLLGEAILPGGDYRGWMLSLDREALERNPPEPLSGSGITGKALLARYSPGGKPAPFTAEPNLRQIFESLSGGPEQYLLPFRRIKTLELLVLLAAGEGGREKRLTEYPAEQVEIIRQVHDRLTGNLSERCSIEELSRQYLMNPTTLKQMFKTIYGTSIAAHIREHRMEAAAGLLARTDMSIADIAQRVGYDSQSRFSAAFKAYYGMLPKEYRRKCASQEIYPDTGNLDG